MIVDVDADQVQIKASNAEVRSDYIKSSRNSSTQTIPYHYSIAGNANLGIYESQKKRVRCVQCARILSSITFFERRFGKLLRSN